MSEIELKSIVSFNSEDTNFKAINLIDGNSKSKWLGSNDNETKNYVIIQLDEPSEIRQIDLENASSAFIEIQAGNKDDSEDDFTVILPPVSFMTPTESKNQLHTTRFKILIDEIDKDTLTKKWDVIKIICTQPFNNMVQFGITSVRIYKEATIDQNKIDAAALETGVFELKKESELLSSDKDQGIESVFQKWKTSKRDDQDQKATTTSKYDDEEVNQKVTTNNESDLSVFQKWKNSTKKSPEINSENVSKEQEIKSNDQSSEGSMSSKPPNKDRSNKRPERLDTLKGVIFVLSGFQNPERSTIRDMGLKLGAKYRPAWDENCCTHLICAFPNTPKANQVKESGGKIVTKEWLEACEKQSKLLDDVDYKLKSESEDSDSDSSGSGPRKAARKAQTKLKKLKKAREEDSFDESDAENSDDRDFIVSDGAVESESSSSSSSSKSSSSTSDHSDKVVSKKRKSKKKSKSSKHKKVKKESSNTDSSDEEERIKKKVEKGKKLKKEDKENKTHRKAKKKEINYSDDDTKPLALQKTSSNSSDKTDVNSDLEDSSSCKKDDWELPEIFDGKKFYIYGDFDKKKRNMLNRAIIGFAGDVENYMSEEINYVITDKAWNDDFKKSKQENKSLIIVGDDWINACVRRKKLISYEPFEVEND